ncbi:hypothetical protein [Streptomyces sp. NPDC007063]|uniref:hypothetical protein n=1 Tax=Streptomyces sp. NPDC007063 TaxID=3364772 RepID=UPI003692F219
MTAAPAALAVIRAALEDTTTLELLNRPGAASQRIAHALESAGWTIEPTHPPNGPQTAAQHTSTAA